MVTKERWAFVSSPTPQQYHHWCSAWFPQEVFLWNTVDPHSRRPCRWNWQRWPDWYNSTGLLKSLWQAPRQVSLEAGFLWHQKQDQEMDWGLPFHQIPAGGSHRPTFLHELIHLRCTPRLHPGAISLLGDGTTLVMESSPECASLLATPFSTWFGWLGLKHQITN